MTINYIDLNIDTILENWTVEDALRELIANALDETMMSNCKKQPNIEYKSQQIKIQDFGRGIMEEHFIQNENNEKKKNDSTIGTFGIGLKDAIAVLTRYDKKITIYSKFGSFTPIRKDKHGVSKGILTIHMKHDIEDIHQNTQGTLIVVDDVDEDMFQKTLKRFIQFNPSINRGKINTCDRGDLYEKDGISEIYLNGMKISENDDLLFSYNITKPDADLKKAINRERKSISIDKYRKIIIKIVLESINPQNPELVDRIFNSRHNSSKTECSYTEVMAKILKTKEEMGENVLITNDQHRSSAFSQYAADQNYEVITVNNAFYKTLGEKHEISTLQSFGQEYVSNYDAEIVYEHDVSKLEYKHWQEGLEFIKHFANNWPKLMNIYHKITFDIVDNLPNCDGIANFAKLNIQINKRILFNQKHLIAVLLHEICHLTSGDANDSSLEFEDELTNCFGELYYFFQVKTTIIKNNDLAIKKSDSKKSTFFSYLSKLIFS